MSIPLSLYLFDIPKWPPKVTFGPSISHLALLCYFDVLQSCYTVTCWVVDTWFVMTWHLRVLHSNSLSALSLKLVSPFSNWIATRLSWPLGPKVQKKPVNFASDISFLINQHMFSSLHRLFRSSIACQDTSEKSALFVCHMSQKIIHWWRVNYVSKTHIPTEKVSGI